MKRRICSIIFILSFILNFISSEVFAQTFQPEEVASSPIYNVVVPTNYSFIVDPYEFFDKNSMIASPEFNLINKSSVPVQVDISFQITTKEGVVLSILNNRNEVNASSMEKQIWLAAVFDKGISRKLLRSKVLMTPMGDIVYKYEDGYGINSVSRSAIQVIVPKTVVATEDELTDKKDEVMLQDSIADNKENHADQHTGELDNITKPDATISIIDESEALSDIGSAVPVNTSANNTQIANNSDSSIVAGIEAPEAATDTQLVLDGSGQTNLTTAPETVSGTAIDSIETIDQVPVVGDLAIDSSDITGQTQVVNSATIDSVDTIGQVQVVGGSAIDFIEAPSQMQTVSGSAIDFIEAPSQTQTVSGSAIDFIEAPSQTQTVSGSAIDSIEAPSQIQVVSGSAIKTVINTEPAVTGAAVTIEKDQTGSQTQTTTVSGSSINVKVDTDKQPTTDSESLKDTDEKTNNNVKTGYNKAESTGTTTITEYIPVNGTPVVFQDTLKVFGNYGNIEDLNVDSPNILVIGNEWNTRTVLLDKAKTYQLIDGTVITGETAGNDQGVASFRFVGSVNPNIKWSETELKVTIKYDINNSSELKKADSTQKEKDNASVNNDSVSSETIDINNEKTEFNNIPNGNAGQLSEDSNTEIKELDTGQNANEIPNTG